MIIFNTHYHSLTRTAPKLQNIFSIMLNTKTPRNFFKIPATPPPPLPSLSTMAHCRRIASEYIFVLRKKLKI